MASEDKKKLITFDQLKQVVLQLVRIGKDAVVKTLKLSHTESTDENAGTTLSEDENHHIIISHKSGNNTVTRTVATCEDYNQTITATSLVAQTITPGCLALSDGIIPTGYTDVFYLLPTARMPKGRSAADLNYGGRILTTKNRAYDIVVVDEDTVTPRDVVIESGMYYQLVGTRFHITFPELTTFTTRTSEYWIFISIPFGPEPEDIDIQFDNSNLIWASGEPDWQASAGTVFQIHIIGNIATVMMRRKIDGIMPAPYQSDSIGDGDWEDLVKYISTTGNSDRDFQWMLRFQDGNSTIVKPVWHLKNGTIIDAFGCTISISSDSQVDPGTTNGGNIS